MIPARFITTIGKPLLLAALVAGAASAHAPTYISPADALTRLNRFDGQHVAVGGRLHREHDRRCLSLGDGIRAGRFVIGARDAARIGAQLARLAGRFVIVEGTLRAGPPGILVTDRPMCGNSSIEGVTMREAEP